MSNDCRRHMPGLIGNDNTNPSLRHHAVALRVHWLHITAPHVNHVLMQQRAVASAVSNWGCVGADDTGGCKIFFGEEGEFVLFRAFKGPADSLDSALALIEHITAAQPPKDET